jgi:hypothetical protein
VLTDGERRIDVKNAWIDFWARWSTRARSREQLDRDCARHGYEPVMP